MPQESDKAEKTVPQTLEQLVENCGGEYFANNDHLKPAPYYSTTRNDTAIHSADVPGQPSLASSAKSSSPVPQNQTLSSTPPLTHKRKPAKKAKKELTDRRILQGVMIAFIYLVVASTFLVVWFFPSFRYQIDRSVVGFASSNKPAKGEQPPEAALEEKLKGIQKKQEQLGIKTAAPESRTVQDYIQQADKGDANAEFALARIYEVGKMGQPVDIPEAVKWYKRSIAHGYTMAIYDFGCYYWSGAPGQSPDKRQAMALWMKGSAKQGTDAGISECTYALARIAFEENRYGDGAKLLQLAVKQGSSAACKRLANLYALGFGVKQNWEQAGQLAAKVTNDRENLRFIAWLTREALAGPLNVDSEKWNETSATYGDQAARYYLVSKSKSKNNDYWKAALYTRTDDEWPDAQYNLGRLYLDKGDGQMAQHLFERAARNNNSDAAYELYLAYSGLNPQLKINVNKSAASYYYSKLYGQDEHALFLLGKTLELGQGIAPSKTEAVESYRQARALGSYEAEERLLQIAPEYAVTDQPKSANSAGKRKGR